MKVFLAALLLIGIGVFGMCFNIIFRKNGEFPQFDVGSNKNMRKMGIRCMKEEDAELHAGGKSVQKHSVCSGDFSDSCIGCSLYDLEKERNKNTKE